MTCLAPDVLRIGSTNDIRARYSNRDGTNVTDATANFELVNDIGTDIGVAMPYDATYVADDSKGVQQTGWYVGQVIPSVANFTDDGSYDIVYNASGGALTGTFREAVTVPASS